MTESVSPNMQSDTPPGGYDPASIELKWQERWRSRSTNHTDLENSENPFYQLMMFPYPSAEGLHVGNLFAFTGSDIFARFQRLAGKEVFQPLGYDAFGIHSENYALKIGEHPMRLIPRNIANFRRQLERSALMVDWRYELSTTDPEYYRWTQWVFLQLLKRGLAYKKKAAVNWCPNDKTVLANEQVIAGACERCGAMVEQRFLEQWFFEITRYAQRLLENLDWLDWSDTTKAAQRNWIGKSEGARVNFHVIDRLRTPASSSTPISVKAVGAATSEAGSGDEIEVFTTRVDTIFGATYLVLAPEHPLVRKITTDEYRSGVDEYIERSARQDLISRKTNKEKTGVFTGAYARNPATNRPVPVWVADYVLMEYGTGAIMAVPGHDERDFEFSQRYSLPIVRVVAAPDDTASTPLSTPFTDEGENRMVNSPGFDGLTVEEGKKRVLEMLVKSGSARGVVNYRLHDWCISRQRYWGPPIPVVYCDTCGMQPVPEKDLPVLLPDVPDFVPDDSGVSPLARQEAWYKVPCPQCGKSARRETDVSDTFLDSAWYFLRYPSARRDDVPFDAAVTQKWLPVNSYIGGNEHAVLHLLYSRFITMVLHDAGHLSFEEPYRKFRAHGLIIREGAKMSKSRGNVVNPDQYIDEWGADSFRTYLMFLGPYEEGGDFRDRSILGVKRFLDRLWTSVEVALDSSRAPALTSAEVMRKLHQTIRKVTEDIPKLSYNTAIAAMMEYMNVLRAHDRAAHRDEVAPVVQMVSPFAPHIAEELWEKLGNADSVFDSRWPGFDPSLASEDTIELAVQVNGKLRGTIQAAREVSKEDALSAAMRDAAIAKFVSGEPKKVIFVPGRLLNIVV